MLPGNFEQAFVAGNIFATAVHTYQLLKEPGMPPARGLIRNNHV